jgi:thiamine-phosphate diphosphorylase
MFIWRHEILLGDMTPPAQERRDVILRLTEAATLLGSSMDVRLIPGAGTNLVYAIRGARDGKDIAGIEGGIVTKRGKVQLAGPCLFDSGGEASRIVLTAMKFDPAMRSASAIRFSSEALGILDDMFIECRELDRTNQTPGISTMEWGIAYCCSDGVPEVIFDRGTAHHEGLIRLIGEDPVEVANNIIILSNRIE